MIQCKSICRNYLCTKKFYSSQCFFLKQIFSLCSILMQTMQKSVGWKRRQIFILNENILLWLAICVTSTAPSIFLKFSQDCCETTKLQIQQSKVKLFFVKKRQESLNYRKCIIQNNGLVVHLILGYIFENKTQKQKRQMFFDKIWSIRTKHFHLK